MNHRLIVITFYLVFSAYIYYVVSVDQYQLATSLVKASALMAFVLSGVLGDILVVLYDTSLQYLMWISAAFVWSGFLVGLFVIRSSNKSMQLRNSDMCDENDSVVSNATNNQAPTTNQNTAATVRQHGEVDNSNAVLPTADEEQSYSFFNNSLFHHTLSQLEIQNQSTMTTNLLISEDTTHADTTDHQSAKRVTTPGTVNLSELKSLDAKEDNQSHLNILYILCCCYCASQNTRKLFQLKWDLFRKQVDCLKLALRSRSLVAMLLFWLSGNAIYTVISNEMLTI